VVSSLRTILNCHIPELLLLLLLLLLPLPLRRVRRQT
jgi:hypothetical protein